MPGDIRQRFAQRRRDVVVELRRNRGVDRAGQGQPRLEAEHPSRIRQHREYVTAQAPRAAADVALQRENRRTDLGDGGVEVIDVAHEPVPDRLVGEPAQRALQAEADTEDPLDDPIVQISGDPVPVDGNR